MNYCCIANICKLYNVIAAAHVYDIMIELSFFCTRNSRTCCPNEATANRCRHSPHPLDSVELKGLVKRPW